MAVAVNVLISAVVFIAAGKGSHITYGVALALVLLLAAALFDAEVDPYRSGVYHQHGRFENRSEYRQALEREKGAAAISFSDYGLYGSVVVKEEGPVKVLMINGKVDAGTGLDVPTELLLGYIPTLMHPDPKDVAIIGLGSGITLAAVESFPVERIDVLELNPTVVEAAELFEPENRNALDDERVELIVGDARDYLSTTDRTYDIVISEPSNPWIEGEVFLFTREFYSVVAERLNEGGLFLQWIGAYDFNPEDLKISLRTLETAFPHVQAWADAKGVDFFLLASKGAHRQGLRRDRGRNAGSSHRVRHRGYLGLVGADRRSPARTSSSRSSLRTIRLSTPTPRARRSTPTTVRSSSSGPQETEWGAQRAAWAPSSTIRAAAAPRRRSHLL